MTAETTGWKFETCDGEDWFEFKAKGGKKAIAELNRIMNQVEEGMKNGENVNKTSQ